MFGLVDSGDIDTLLVFGDALDPEDTVGLDSERLAKLKNVIYVGPFMDETARQASIVLPAAGWAEEDGSFVNFEDRVQWTRRCHLPRGEGRPGWRVAADVAAEAGIELPAWSSAADVLDSMAGEIDRFRGLSASGLGLLGNAASAAAASV